MLHTRVTALCDDGMVWRLTPIPAVPSKQKVGTASNYSTGRRLRSLFAYGEFWERCFTIAALLAAIAISE